jgi:hypothetical protein
MNSRYFLGAYWPSRRESIVECADRLAKFLSALADCDPDLATWYEQGGARKGASELRARIEDKDYLLDLLDRGRSKRDVGRDVIEELGFRVGLWNGGSGDRESGLSITCGLYWESANPNAGLSNSVVLQLPKSLGTLSEAKNMARVLTVVAEAWEPAWAGVLSRAAMRARNFDPALPFVDWMAYVPSEIDQVPSPSTVLRLAGLGSIIVVQTTPPSIDNPEELTRIRRIDEILRKVPA